MLGDGWRAQATSVVLTVLGTGAAGVGFWSLDIPSGSQYCSPGLCSLLELDAERLTSGRAAWLDALPPGEAKAASLLVQQSVTSRTPFRATYKVTLPSSVERWIDIHGAATHDASGAPLTFSGYCFDVTDRHKVEEEYQRIKELQGFLLTLTDALAPLSDPIQIQIEACRVLGRYLGVNRVFYAEADDTGLNRAGPQYVDGVPPTGEVWHSSDFDPTLMARYSAGEVLTCDDVGASLYLDEHQRAAYASDDIVAWAAVPIAKPGLPTGRLVIHQNTPRHWSRFEIDLIRETAERDWEPLFAGQGRHPSNSWPAEPSLLALGLDLAVARRLGAFDAL